MSLLSRRRGGRRGRIAAGLVTAGTLVAFQALAVIGANVALAATSCTYSGGVLTVTSIGAAETVTFQVTGDGSSRIFITGVFTLPQVNGTTLQACAGATADATVSNTTAIAVVGDSTFAQSVVIFMDKGALGTSTNTTSWGTINWSVSLGSDSSDVLEITNQGADPTNPANSINVTLGASGIDLNTDEDLDVTVSGVDTTMVLGGPTSDTIWGAGDETTGGLYAGKMVVDGGDDVVPDPCSAFPGDFVSGGASDDVLSGGADTSGCNEDFVDYSAAAGVVNASLLNGIATGMGVDNLCTVLVGGCDVTPPVGAWSANNIPPGSIDDDGNSFEDLGGSAQNDILAGDDALFGNVITPGGGDDSVDGNAGFDYIDFSDSEEAVTVDMAAGTATGNGNDTFSDFEGALGSGGDDTFIDDTTADNDYRGSGGNDTFDQGTDPAIGDEDLLDGDSGIDVVDYSQRADDLKVVLGGSTCSFDSGDQESSPEEEDCIRDIENASLGTGNDNFQGNDFNNQVFPGGGQNVLDGNGGIDGLDYSIGYESGVTVNMAGGGPTGGSADAAVDFENAVGTEFNDTLLGTDVTEGTNGANQLKGGKGNDTLSGNAGPDFLIGGPGNDSTRGGSGDDNLKGKGGRDNLRGGSGDDDLFGGKGKDTCNGGAGSDLLKSCEKKIGGKAKALTAAREAKLATLA